MRYDDVPVSDTDELTVVGGRRIDRTRKMGEFEVKNAPLSAAEIDRQKLYRQRSHGQDRGWVPRTAENIEDTVPLTERDLMKIS
jgi:hypothetical protein